MHSMFEMNKSNYICVLMAIMCGSIHLAKVVSWGIQSGMAFVKACVCVCVCQVPDILTSQGEGSKFGLND